MFGRKSRRQKKQEKKEEFNRAVHKGLLFWLPGGSSRLDVYLDYCILHCLGKTRMKETSRTIPFTSIEKIIFTPATPMRHASLQLFTKEMPDVKRSFWYPYENNMVVVHPSTEEIALKIFEYIKDPYGSNVIPPEYLNELKKERKKEIREEKEAKAKAEAEEKEAAKVQTEDSPDAK